jgi:AbrB family transcriptional regulator (stage V sporulation protein T)
MKATGIIRRVDDLGRISIPKEVRRVARVKEGDPMEVLPADGGIFLRRYDSTKTIGDVLQELEDLVSYADEIECRATVLENIKAITVALQSEGKE